MDTKHQKQRKHHKKMKASTDDGNTEVFVLPPDLLKKLGIRLGNVSNSLGSVPDVAVAGDEIENETFNNNSESNHTSRSSDDASILETANLMKKSVFLSPTFVSTVANVFPGEMEIASVVKELDAPIIATEMETVNNTIFPLDNVEIIETTTATETSLIINPTMNGVFTNVLNIEHNNRTQIDYSLSTNNNITVSLNTTANIENELDEEYFINYDNNNSNHTHDPSQVTYPQAQKHLSKINIISQEIIGPSKLKGLKRLPNITDLTPVTIDTKIGIKSMDTVHKPVHKSSQNCLDFSESQVNKNEVLNTDRNTREVNCGSKKLNVTSTIAGDVTQNNTDAVTEHSPEKNMTHGFDNCSSQAIYNVINPKVACHKNAEGNSSKQINAEETCDSDVIEKNTEKNEPDICKLTSDVTNINSLENNVSLDLNITGQNLYQKEISYAHEVVNMDIDSNISSLIKTTFEVKQDDSVVKLSLNSDCNNVHNCQSSEITSNDLFYLESDNSKSENKLVHNSEIIVEKKLKQHGDPVAEVTTHSCEILYSKYNEVFMVDDNSEIPKEKKGTLDLLKQKYDSTIFPDTLRDKMVSLVTYDSERSNINNKEIHNNLIYYPAKDDETNLEINGNILCNVSLVSNNVCDDNSHNDSKIMPEGRILSTVNNTLENCQIDTTNDGNRNDSGQRNIDLKICGNINYEGQTKELKPCKVSKKNVKHDSKIYPIIPSDGGKPIEDYDLNKSKSLVNGPNGKVQQDNPINKELNTVNNDSTNSTSDINDEKVKEIAAYLKTLKDIHSDKKKINNKKITNNNSKHESIEMNPNTMKSKLIIQGVEKPGGIITGNNNKLNVFKTYQRQNRLKHVSFPITNNCFTAECKVTDVYSDEINTTVISANVKTQEFCICNDFGRLDYYDSDDLYEHIHFCRHHSTHCDLDLIFNIYNDDQVVSNQKEINNEFITEEENETVELNICWSAVQCRDKDCCTATDIFDEVTELKHELIDEKNGARKTCDVNMMSATDVIISDTDNIVSVSNEDGKPDSINPLKHNIYIPSSDLQNPVKGDAISASYAHIHNSNLINFERDSVVSDPNEENHNSDISSDNLNIVSTTDNVPHIKITKEKSDFSIDNVVNDMDNFGDNVINYKSHGTEITIKQNESNLENIVKADETMVDENVLSIIKNESSDDEEENLFEIKKKISISNPKLDESTPRKLSNKKDKIKRKRKSAVNTPGSVNDTDEPDAKRRIKCAVCHELLSEKKWENHVIGEHQFIAWIAGDAFDLDDAELQRKLKQSLKIVGFLKCTFCNLEINKLKKFMEHIRTCMKLKDSITGKETEETATESHAICGVCKTEVQSSCWIEHIGKYHNYLAWIDGLDPLNLDDEQAVRDHLLQILKRTGELYCYKCGVVRKRTKAYLSHIESCEGDEVNLASTSDEKQYVKCGVCTKEVSSLCWIEHIAKEHNYLAWPDNTQPLKLDDQEAVWEHLQQFIRNDGGLTCYKCGLIRKRVKLYLNHIEKCDGSKSYLDNSTVSNDLSTLEGENAEKPTTRVERKEFVTCGVCKQVVSGLTWIEHISKEHDYMAWEDGSTVLDREDSEAVRSHLYNIAKQNGGLVCKKCGITRKYVKSYLEHMKECTGATLDCSKLDGTTDKSILLELSNITTPTIVCGVCKTEVKKENWVEHMSIEHEYLAWIDGHTPIDVNNDEEVQRHLYALLKVVNGFKCAKCELVRKYVKSYMQHIKVCQGSNNETVITAMRNNEMLECAVCHEQMDAKEWRQHAMEKHYNIAWVVGDPDVDLNNPYAVEGFIKEYQQKYTKLICKVCGISRVSRVGFYAHILTCGKTEAEIEMFRAVCKICNNKYLRIYKSQHMTAHREAEFAKERKLVVAEERKKKNEEPVEQLSGRRKAAEKAKTVIEKYKNSVSEGCHRCPTCGFSTEIESELSGHICVEYDGEGCSDSDESVDMDQWSEDESVDTDIDSNLSDEELLSEELGSKKKRHSDASAARVRVPFSVNNPRSYLKQSGREFIEMYWSTEDLFTQWRSSDYEAVNEHDEPKYLPPIAESCKIRLADKTEEWTTYSRFEARKGKPCISMFVGASIRSIAWAPSPLDRAVSESEPHYLAVACHVAADEPREPWDHTAAGPALIQIWDYGNMRVAPQFVLGVALDYGTVWAMDWCPSGTRDAPSQQDDKNTRRLGLLATACSNGFAYIFSVPYPSTITEKGKIFYKLKPVAELRLTMSASRKVYQATSLKWSQQKGHGHILVGYSDGTMAYYDLNIESPILKTTENNITIIYPYNDERFLNGCIEGVDLYPAAEGAAMGAGCGASAAGCCAARAAGGPRGARAHASYTHVAAARAAFLPHWPSAMLVGDDALLSTSVNEVEWWGGGRRFGGARAAAACARCARAVLAQLQLLRLHTAHPLYPDLHKLVVGIIEMTPLNDKKKRKQNDDLSMVVEPTTYESAVKKYGLEYQVITGRDRVSQQKVTSVVRQPYPERFPLADMTSLAFCSSEQHHDRLAVAVHAGFVLIVNL